MTYLSQLILSEQQKLREFLKTHSLLEYLEEYENKVSHVRKRKRTLEESDNIDSLEMTDTAIDEMMISGLNEEYLDKTLKQAMRYLKDLPMDGNQIISHGKNATLIRTETEDFISRNKALKILILIERRLKVEGKLLSSKFVKHLGVLINQKDLRVSMHSSIHSFRILLHTLLAVIRNERSISKTIFSRLKSFISSNNSSMLDWII